MRERCGRTTLSGAATEPLSPVWRNLFLGILHLDHIFQDTPVSQFSTVRPAATKGMSQLLIYIFNQRFPGVFTHSGMSGEEND